MLQVVSKAQMTFPWAVWLCSDNKSTHLHHLLAFFGSDCLILDQISTVVFFWRGTSQMKPEISPTHLLPLFPIFGSFSFFLVLFSKVNELFGICLTCYICCHTTALLLHWVTFWYKFMRMFFCSYSTHLRCYVNSKNYSGYTTHTQLVEFRLRHRVIFNISVAVTLPTVWLS